MFGYLNIWPDFKKIHICPEAYWNIPAGFFLLEFTIHEKQSDYQLCEKGNLSIS